MMAGWISRVVTVTYGPRYERVPGHQPNRRIDVRGPVLSDAPRVVPSIPARPRQQSTPAAWAWLIGELEDYARRWGSNPLAISHRIGAGAKEGKRGRGSQDYLFQR